MVLSYAVMHFLVDFLCAWGMFAIFGRTEDSHFQMLVYNFCAFALQLPLGTALDVAVCYMPKRWKTLLPRIWTAVGVVATFAGVFSRAWLLGLGNALFHVGGGMDVMWEDLSKNRKGRLLGVFVSPGAIGIYLGGLLGMHPAWNVFWVVGAVLLVLTVSLFFRRGHILTCTIKEQIPVERTRGWLSVCCLVVVIIRSVTGFYTAFPWKAEPVLGALAVLAVASGKLAGGFFSAWFGLRRTAFGSLILSGLCFLMSHRWEFGVIALFLFNMSMPITLYLLARNFRDMLGFAFGLLTFGLFLGFLPVYLNLYFPWGAALSGMLGCLLSIGVLLLCRRGMNDPVSL